MSFPNKSFNKVLPSEPVCICIKGVYSWYTTEQIKKLLEEKITHHIVEITDVYIKPGNFTNDVSDNFTNDVYVCFSNWFWLLSGGITSYYGCELDGYELELECMTDAFAYGASYAISAPDSEWDDLEWTCYYVDSVLSYSDIMKNTEPIAVDSYVNVVVAVETDDLYDNDTISTHSSMPELIDAEDDDADDDDMDMDVEDESDAEDDAEEESDAEDDAEEESDAEDDAEEESDAEDAEENIEEEESDAEEDIEKESDADESDDEKCNVEHNISQVLDWVLLKCDLNDTKTVIRLLIALNYMNILINCALLMLIIQSF
jgi:hypothetical protein